MKNSTKLENIKNPDQISLMFTRKKKKKYINRWLKTITEHERDAMLIQESANLDASTRTIGFDY